MVAVSFLVLYLELALIRWVPGYLHNFGYFTNFAMLAAFLGIGLGCLLPGRRTAVAYLPCALMALVAVVRLAHLKLELSGGSGGVFWSEQIIEGGAHASASRAKLVVFLGATLAFVGGGPRLAARIGASGNHGRGFVAALVTAAYLPFVFMLVADIAGRASSAVDLGGNAREGINWLIPLHDDSLVPPTTLFVLGLFLLITLTFVGLGQTLGTLFGALPRLRAYGLNVFGGLTGIVVFAAHSHYEHSPVVWFSVCAVVTLPFLAETPRALWGVHALVLGTFLWVVSLGTENDVWGPYYRQTLIKAPSGFMLAGNGIPGMALADFEHLGNTEMYEVPYSSPMRALRKHPDAPVDRALVIGCGGGNDVAMALLNDAHHVDAVDINAWGIEMGKQHHPLKPLHSDRVSTYVADGREFLARPGGKYDLIVYGLPDSMFTNDRSNLRVESFIFTREAFESVRSRLTDDGVLVVYNYYRVPWLIEKIRGMLRDSFGQEPYVKQFLDKDGKPASLYPAALAVGPGLALPAPAKAAMPSPATDDWPFLYLTGRVLPRPYVNALAGVGALSLGLVLGALAWMRRRERQGGHEANEGEDGALLATLFFMGVAFVLLETRSVVTFGLFFGSTWWNNVVVFAAIHVSVLLAVLVNARFPSIPRRAMAAALVASLLFAWALPPSMLLVGGTATRAVLAGAVAFLPIFCANVLFASVFKSAKEGRVSYAFNLLGGMLGGLLEYVSLLIGYRALVVVALALYVAALACMFRYARRTLSADEERWISKTS